MHQILQNIQVVSGAQVAIKTSKLQIMFPRHNTRLYKDAYKSLIKKNKFHTRGKINEMENLRKTKAAQNAHYLLKIIEVVGLKRDLARMASPVTAQPPRRMGWTFAALARNQRPARWCPPITPHSNTPGALSSGIARPPSPSDGSRNESIASCKQQLRMTTGNLITFVIFPFGPLT
jgi:hypothetical protein